MVCCPMAQSLRITSRNFAHLYTTSPSLPQVVLHHAANDRRRRCWCENQVKISILGMEIAMLRDTSEHCNSGLLCEKQSFVIDPMIHGKPMQYFKGGTYMVKLAPFMYNHAYITLPALQSVDAGFFLLLTISCYNAESYITPKFLGREIDWSPTLIDISIFLLGSSHILVFISLLNFKMYHSSILVCLLSKLLCEICNINLKW